MTLAHLGLIAFIFASLATLGVIAFLAYCGCVIDDVTDYLDEIERQNRWHD